MEDPLENRRKDRALDLHSSLKKQYIEEYIVKHLIESGCDEQKARDIGALAEAKYQTYDEPNSKNNKIPSEYEPYLLRIMPVLLLSIIACVTSFIIGTIAH